MKRSTIGWIVAFLLAAGGSVFAYLFYFAGGSGEPTVELTTPSSPSTVGTASEQSFEIDSGGTVARFVIDEELQGEPNQVVGTTDQVVGVITFDPADLSTIQFSEILVNARTLDTDSDRRNRAIRGPVILDAGSDEHELITLTNTTVAGLSDEATVGETYQFTVTGDLTVKGTTKSVEFDVTATLVDESTIEGSAEATVLRGDFGIGIPSVPGVANVTDEVVIALDFTAISG